MKLLIKNAYVHQEQSSFNNKQVDLLIEDGIITKIAKNISADDAQVVQSDDLHISAGWVDLGTQIGEPGYEHRDDILSVTKTAARGGYTKIMAFPNTNPVADNRSQIERIKYISHNNLVDILPIGSVSQKSKGIDLAELHDMHEGGAVAFSDGDHPIQNSGLLLRAMEYVQAFNGLIIQTSMDKQLAIDGQMHEGAVSTSLGLPGISSMSEYATVDRDLKMRDYSDGQLLLHTISASESVKFIKNAKKTTDRLYASVSFQNLLHIDEDLTLFDSNLKLMPPLRTKSDRKALIDGLKNGAINIVCSNHTPLEEERKKLEFTYASFGATGLEVCFAALNTHLAQSLDLDQILNVICYNVRDIFKIQTTTIEVGNEADLTLFDPKKQWTYRSSLSKSKNNSYFDEIFKGAVVGIVHNRQHQLFN